MLSDAHVILCLIAGMVSIGIVGTWLINQYVDPRLTRGGQTGFDVKRPEGRK